MRKRFVKILFVIGCAAVLLGVTRMMMSRQEREVFKNTVREGDIQGVSKMIKKHPEFINLDFDPNRQDQLKPLSVAAGLGEVDMCSNLIALGANINEVDKHNYTPLHQTVLPDQINAAKFLIKNGANLNLKDQEGLTPLEMAETFKASSNMINLLSNAVAGNSANR